MVLRDSDMAARKRQEITEYRQLLQEAITILETAEPKNPENALRDLFRVDEVLGRARVISARRWGDITVTQVQ